jgi:hypothetical protein
MAGPGTAIDSISKTKLFRKLTGMPEESLQEE